MLWFLLILPTEASLGIAPAGDDTPASYPVVDLHLDLPLQRRRNFGIPKRLSDYEKKTVAWRKQAVELLGRVQSQISEMIETIGVRDTLLIDEKEPSSSFLQGVPGLNVVQGLSTGFGSGFKPITIINTPPIPVLNILADRPPNPVDFPSNKEELAAVLPLIPDTLTIGNMSLPLILEEQERQWNLLKDLSFDSTGNQASSFLQPNYVEDNSAPFDELHFALAGASIEDADAIPIMYSIPTDGTGIMRMADEALDKTKMSTMVAELSALNAQLGAKLRGAEVQRRATEKMRR